MEKFSIKIALGNRESRNVDVDWDRIPAHNQHFMKHYGLKQKLNDCHVSKDSAEDKWELVQKTLDKLYNGNLEVRESTSSDPVMQEIMALARKNAGKHFAKKGVKPESIAKSDWNAVVEQYAKVPAIIAAATAIAAQKAALGNIDLDDLDEAE